MIDTKSAYARSRKERGLPGGTKQAVQKAVDSGRIQLTRDGRVDFDQADAAWLANTSVEQQQRGAPKSKAGPPRADGSKDGDAPADDLPPEDYLAARARKEAALADLAEMEAAETRGELFREGDVVDTWGEVAAAIRARMLVLPSMAAPMVAAPGKTAEVQAILLKLVHEALNELGEGLPKRAGRGKRGHAAATSAA